MLTVPVTISLAVGVWYALAYQCRAGEGTWPAQLFPDIIFAEIDKQEVML